MQQPQLPQGPSGLSGISGTQVALLGGTALLAYTLFGRAGLVLGPAAFLGYLSYNLRGLNR